MRKTIALLILAAVLTAALTGCGPSLGSKANDGKLNVVATIFPAYDFARAVGKDRINLSLLVKPGVEIHSFDPTPADIVKVEHADVFIYIGGESDAWVSTILKSINTKGKQIVRLMDDVTTVKEVYKAGMQVKGTSGGAGSSDYDEHIWTSPKNAVKLVGAVQKALCRADQPNAGFYTKNAKAYQAGIRQVDTEIAGLVKHASRKTIVVADRFPFRYLVDEFGLGYAAAYPGCSTETDVSAATLAYLINTVKAEKIPCVYYVEMSNRAIAKIVKEQTGTGTALLHSCENVTKQEFDSGATYLSLMKANVASLRKGLN